VTRARRVPDGGADGQAVPGADQHRHKNKANVMSGYGSCDLQRSDNKQEHGNHDRQRRQERIDETLLQATNCLQRILAIAHSRALADFLASEQRVLRPPRTKWSAVRGLAKLHQA
jgi:hypothetical protein